MYDIEAMTSETIFCTHAVTRTTTTFAMRTCLAKAPSPKEGVTEGVTPPPPPSIRQLCFCQKEDALWNYHLLRLSCQNNELQ